MVYLYCLLSVSAPLEHQRPFVSPTDFTSGHTDPTASDNPPPAAALLPGWAEGDGEQAYCWTSPCPVMGEERGLGCAASSPLESSQLPAGELGLVHLVARQGSRQQVETWRAARCLSLEPLCFHFDCILLSKANHRTSLDLRELR